MSGVDERAVEAGARALAAVQDNPWHSCDAVMRDNYRLDAEKCLGAAAPIIAAAAVSERDREWREHIEKRACELDSEAKLRREWRDEAVSDYGKADWERIAALFEGRAEVLRSLLDGSFAPGATTGGVSESTDEKGEN